MRLLYNFSLLLLLAIVLLQYTSTASPIPTATHNTINKRGPPEDISGKWNHPHGCPSPDDKDKRDLIARGGGGDDEDCPTTTTTSTHSPTATATSSPDHDYPPSDDPSKSI